MKTLAPVCEPSLLWRGRNEMLEPLFLPRASQSWLAEAESRMLSNRPDSILRQSRHLDHATTLNNNGSHEKDR